MQVPPLGGEEERPRAHTAVPCLFVWVSVHMSVLSGPLPCRRDPAALQPGAVGAEAGPDPGCFLPVSVSHLGQGSDRDEPKRMQVRITQLGARRKALEVTCPGSSKGKAGTTEASPDDFRGTWAPLQATLVLTVRKLVPF